MNETASAAYVAELRNQIAILSERCALLAAELANARATAQQSQPLDRGIYSRQFDDGPEALGR
jgi:uncharacterized small protein (DUF1192 family)